VSIPRTFALAAIASAPLLAPTEARAQLLSTQPETLPPARHWVGGDFAVAQPQGEFGDVIGTGYGAAANYMYLVDRRGILGLRVDGSFLNYGNERQRICFNYTTCRVQLDVTTSNNIAAFGVGPQLMMPSGAIRPYVAGSVGLSYFFTQSSVDGTDDSNGSFASTNNYDDTGFAWTGMAGLLIPESSGRVPVSIDLAARYHGNGQRSYLRKGSIVDYGPGKLPTITPHHTEANHITYLFGVCVGIRSSRGNQSR
jgi:hypothetical protein